MPPKIKPFSTDIQGHVETYDENYAKSFGVTIPTDRGQLPLEKAKGLYWERWVAELEREHGKGKVNPEILEKERVKFEKYWTKLSDMMKRLWIPGKGWSEEALTEEGLAKLAEKTWYPDKELLSKVMKELEVSEAAVSGACKRLYGGKPLFPKDVKILEALGIITKKSELLNFFATFLSPQQLARLANQWFSTIADTGEFRAGYAKINKTFQGYTEKDVHQIAEDIFHKKDISDEEKEVLVVGWSKFWKPVFPEVWKKLEEEDLVSSELVNSELSSSELANYARVPHGEYYHPLVGWY